MLGTGNYHGKNYFKWDFFLRVKIGEPIIVLKKIEQFDGFHAGGECVDR